jgi:quercetin dioxygenase-like cupin family protein
MAAEPTDTRSPVVRLGGGRRLVLDTGVTWEQLSTGGSQSVNFMLVTYDVGGSSTVDERLTRHSGYEYGYVISGELNVTLAFEDYQLGAGDAIAFDSATPHRLHNEGDVPVKSIWFVLGRDGHHDHRL